jgi:hypothetical protein
MYMPNKNDKQKRLLAALDELQESMDELKKSVVQYSSYMTEREEKASVSKLKKSIKKA